MAHAFDGLDGVVTDLTAVEAAAVHGGAVAFAIDLGLVAGTRSKAQDAADSAELAAR